MSARAMPPDPASDGGVPVSMLDLDGELLEAIPQAERRLAERFAVGTRHHLPPGRWDPAGVSGDGHGPPQAILLLDGTIVRDIVIGGRATGHLFGPGDILKPWRPIEATFSSDSRWACGGNGAAIAVLDGRFGLAARRWPGISEVVQERVAEQLDTFTLRTAIIGLPRAEHRILALLWQLADRWGTVSPSGVTVGLQLTHELIGRLVAARRPTVSLALQNLIDEGVLTRTDSGAWCLAHGSHALLDPPGAADRSAAQLG